MLYRFVQKHDPVLMETAWFTEAKDEANWYFVKNSLSFNKDTAAKRYESICANGHEPKRKVLMEESL